MGEETPATAGGPPAQRYRQGTTRSVQVHTTLPLPSRGQGIHPFYRSRPASRHDDQVHRHPLRHAGQAFGDDLGVHHRREASLGKIKHHRGRPLPYRNRCNFRRDRPGRPGYGPEERSGVHRRTNSDYRSLSRRTRGGRGRTPRRLLKTLLSSVGPYEPAKEDLRPSPRARTFRRQSLCTAYQPEVCLAQPQEGCRQVGSAVPRLPTCQGPPTHAPFAGSSSSARRTFSTRPRGPSRTLATFGRAHVPADGRRPLFAVARSLSAPLHRRGNSSSGVQPGVGLPLRNSRGHHLG